jgi:hypothetical protein
MRLARSAIIYEQAWHVHDQTLPVSPSSDHQPDRVKILRDGYAKALKEPELSWRRKKRRMDMEPVSGEELQTNQTSDDSNQPQSFNA